MSTPTDLLHGLKYIGKKLNTCLISEFSLKPLPQGYFRAPLGAQKELVWWPPFLICFIWTKVHEKRTWLLSHSRIGIGRIILICKINHFASKSFPSRAFEAARRPPGGSPKYHLDQFLCKNRICRVFRLFCQCQFWNETSIIYFSWLTCSIWRESEGVLVKKIPGGPPGGGQSTPRALRGKKFCL